LNSRNPFFEEIETIAEGITDVDVASDAESVAADE
jgi:hypothetical protein